MKKYIVFDANCVLCTRLAREIQEKSKGELNVLSIHDDGTKALLDTAYPDGWNYAPHFLEVEQENVRGWTGLGVNYQLLKALGVRHAWHIWRLARREGVNRKNKPSQFLFNRRQFMKTGFVTILAR